ncbi:MAG TPA: hypothetical protein VFU68_09280 [Terracidiphilus sp.]|nr:hypothetical protein [Terracidiphilus sp.]
MQSAEEWPPELDALIAAPNHHTLMYENDAVRVLDTRIPAGDTVPVHTHCWPSVLYVIEWSDFVRRDADGRVMVDSRKGKPIPNESALWTEPMPPHTLENVGTNELRVLSVELKLANGDLH